MRKRVILGSLPVLLIGLIGAAVYSFSSGKLTREMVKDIGYYRWAHRTGPFKPHFIETFERDYRFRQRFIGQSIETLRPMFPRLHSGSGYSAKSYRAENVRTFFVRYPGTRHEDFWLDGSEDDFGYCVLVVDGKIADFFFVKG